MLLSRRMYHAFEHLEGSPVSDVRVVPGNRKHRERPVCYSRRPTCSTSRLLPRLPDLLLPASVLRRPLSCLLLPDTLLLWPFGVCGHAPCCCRRRRLSLSRVSAYLRRICSTSLSTMVTRINREPSPLQPDERGTGVLREIKKFHKCESGKELRTEPQT